MSPESPKLRLEALDLISILLLIARTLYFQTKPNLEFTMNVMFHTIEYMHDNRIFGFT